MNVNKMRILLLWCLAFFVLACNKDKVEGFSDGSGEETSTLSFVLKTDYSLNEVALTRAGVVPPDADFKVRIENTRAEVLKTWDYGSVPSLIKVVPGSYKLVAWYGNDSILPAFESPYYYGELKVTLKEGDNLDTIVKSTNAAVKVAVKFDESFGFEYDDYWVDIKTVGDSLSFAKDEKREAFFKPGKLRMRFVLKPKGKNEYLQFYPDPIASVKAKEFYNMTLKAQTKNGALSGISITTDSSTIDIPVNVELPPFYFPKAPPVVSLKGFASGDVIETTEGISKPATVMIASSAGLTELKIKTISDTLIARGWPGEIDLMKASAEQRELLKKSGLDWSKEIDTKDTIKTTVWVKFDNVVKLLNTAPGQTAASAFEIDVKDRFNQVGSSECKFDINVAPPVFEFVNAPGEGNVWAKKVMYDVKYASEVRKPVVECQRAGQEWQSLTTKLNPIIENDFECVGEGLTPTTDYSFRVRLGQHVLDAGTFQTEDILQVPNANMDSWDTEAIRGLKAGINPFASKKDIMSEKPSGGWITVNKKTFNDVPLGSWPYTVNAYPSTISVVNGSGKAALIRSIGWNKDGGNALTGSSDSNSAGRLFLGSYNFDFNAYTDEFNYGIDFASRPNAIKADYMYTPYNGDSFKVWVVLENVIEGVVTQIGYGELINGEAVSGSYKSMNVPITYTDLSKKANRISVVFSSSAGCRDIYGEENTLVKSYMRCLDSHHWEGSCLYVDNIELIYE